MRRYHLKIGEFMDNTYESIITGLTEAIDDVKNGEKKLERNAVCVESSNENDEEE